MGVCDMMIINHGEIQVGNELIEHSFHKYTRFDFFFTGKTGVVILFITPFLFKCFYVQYTYNLILGQLIKFPNIWVRYKYLYDMFYLLQ